MAKNLFIIALENTSEIETEALFNKVRGTRSNVSLIASLDNFSNIVEYMYNFVASGYEKIYVLGVNEQLDKDLAYFDSKRYTRIDGLETAEACLKKIDAIMNLERSMRNRLSVSMSDESEAHTRIESPSP